MKIVIVSALILFASPIYAQDRNCASGAISAIKTDVMLTGLICAVDLFFSFGASGVCVVKVADSIAEAPLKMAVGCAVSVAPSPTYETVSAIGNVSSAIETTKSVGDILQYAF